MSDAYYCSKTASLTIRNQINDDFHLFPELPYDIRVLIWQAVIYQDKPRRLMVRPFDRLTQTERQVDVYTQSNPIAFSINHESRAQALLKHKPVFRLGDDKKAGRPRQYYYRPTVDTLVLESMRSYSDLNTDLSRSESRIWREYVQNLEIHEYDSENMKEDCGYRVIGRPPKASMGTRLVKDLERCKVLKKLLLVKKEPSTSDSGPECDQVYRRLRWPRSAATVAKEREKHRNELETDVRNAFQTMFTKQQIMYRRRTLPVVEVKLETRDCKQV